jgi:hypothetical protein
MPCAFDPPRQAAEPCIMAQLSPSAIPTGGQLGRPLRGLFLSVARRPPGAAIAANLPASASCLKLKE